MPIIRGNRTRACGRFTTGQATLVAHAAALATIKMDRWLTALYSKL